MIELNKNVKGLYNKTSMCLNFPRLYKAQSLRDFVENRHRIKTNPFLMRDRVQFKDCAIIGLNNVVYGEDKKNYDLDSTVNDFVFPFETPFDFCSLSDMSCVVNGICVVLQKEKKEGLVPGKKLTSLLIKYNIKNDTPILYNYSYDTPSLSKSTEKSSLGMFDFLQVQPQFG